MNERTGTDADANNLYNIFLKFGFEVSLFNNLTKDAMLQEMLAGIKVKNWLYCTIFDYVRIVTKMYMLKKFSVHQGFLQNEYV